ncbi:uncharacterized protein LOC108733394 [Agrilus planipennis]|uniref:Uncharacterized protein LOC108733394 n=1 Tax=Agrilus planipennis TaxID=224129 RepID=A0A1W4WHV6_AGRPL|nr:uncharacterized protein LOC108733394 [Agrilus planipennis]
MGGLQHQCSCFLFYFFFVQYLMASAFWNDDASNWFTDSISPASFKKHYPFSQDTNPCHTNYYSEKCRIYRKLVYGSQTLNDVFDEKDRLQSEREKKLSKISVNLNAHSCPCEYNTTYIDLGDNDYFPR